MLRLVWTTSLVLSALSILVMVVLILRRVAGEKREAEYRKARRAVMTALIRFSEEKDSAALHSVLAAAPPSVVADAGSEFLGLVRGGDREAVEAELLAAGLPAFLERELKSANEARRLHAAEMLTSFPAEGSVEPLARALGNDNSREVRIAAAIALAELGALPPLVEVLRKIGVRGQRSRRLVELFRHYPADRLDEVKDYVGNPAAPPFVRAAAIEALMTADAASAERELFARLADDPAPEVAAAALRGLGHVGHPAGLPIIIAKLGAPDWQVRTDAADAAGRCGDPAAVEPLAALLDDEAWTVRYAAAKALRLLGGPGLAALEDLAASGTPRKQRTASLVLSEGVAA